MILFRHRSTGEKPLCRALGVAVPDIPFPQQNTKAERRASLAKVGIVALESRSSLKGTAAGRFGNAQAQAPHLRALEFD
jgi:hypothetical protein